MSLSKRKRDRSASGVPPPVTVRRLGPGDDAVLTHLAVANAAFGALDEREPLQPLTEAETVAFLADDRTATFVAFAGDEAVGFCYTNELYRRHTALRHLCVYEVGVAERFRNQGIGAALLDAVGDHARSRGITQGFVITHASDSSAMSLYAAAGGIRTADDDVIFAFCWR